VNRQQQVLYKMLKEERFSRYQPEIRNEIKVAGMFPETYPLKRAVVSLDGIAGVLVLYEWGLPI
jgi:hypothetical protein